MTSRSPEAFSVSAHDDCHCLGLALSSHNSLNMCDDIKIYCAAVTGSVEVSILSLNGFFSGNDTRCACDDVMLRVCRAEDADDKPREEMATGPAS